MKRQIVVLCLLLLTSLASAQDRPTAYVFEYEDPWTHCPGGGAASLQLAGFDVEPLPLDRSPRDADVDLIFLGSFISDSPTYQEYMKQYSSDLQMYVEQGHVLVQMTQADQTESVPPFLPSALKAHRSDHDFAKGLILQSQAALVANGLPSANEVAFYEGRTLWESFDDQVGFEVAIAGDAEARFPGLMEGAYGKGRIVLTAMIIDKPLDGTSAAWVAFREAFFKNLATHALAVRDGKAQELHITPPPIKPLEYVPGSWTLAVLPDTQVYAESYPGLFFAQTAWLALQRDKYNIKFALQLGDITNRNMIYQWENVRDALSLLDGELPYAFCPGNHDYGPGGNASTRDTYMNEYLPYNRYANTATFGGAMEEGKMDNTYHFFEVGGRKWIVLALEWAPREETIAWANEVMSQYDQDHCGIMITHAYMFNNNLRYDHNDKDHPQSWNPHHYSTPGGINDGQELWDKLIRKHNFMFVFNGHVLGDGTGYLASRNDQGHIVHQMLANYQMRKLGGEGYMRLLEFQPDGKTVHVKTYSPIYNGYLLQADQQFKLTLDR